MSSFSMISYKKASVVKQNVLTNTTEGTSGSGSPKPSGESEFILDF